MSPAQRRTAVVVGGGPTGSLLAVLLAQRSIATTVLERSPAWSTTARPEGRSINLALASRGIRALQAAAAYARVAPLAIPMRGRMLHELDGPPQLAPYGQQPEERIYSISRSELHLALYRLATEQPGVEYRFEHECTDIDVDAESAPRLKINTPAGAQELEFSVAFACDGAGSKMREALRQSGRVQCSEELLDHGYKEFLIPPTRTSDFALDPHALHIWPRGNFMLIALPNTDKSFTATLFLPLQGDVSFASLSEQTLEDFFGQEFPDALPLMPMLLHDFATNPVGSLGTVRCKPFSIAGRIALLGDAAHAIVPFHGQGMNAAFEDCCELAALIDACGRDWPQVLERFDAARVRNAQAIADMALENYTEMRHRVRDPGFRLRSELGFELARRFPDRFVPRYSMVMFRPEIPYAAAQRRGRIQESILHELTHAIDHVGDVDFEHAAALVRDRLDEIGAVGAARREVPHRHSP